jgi:hypothetical protein
MFSQETYTIDGKTYELKSEVTGTLDLLWNVIDGKYRYFIKKENEITELINTKGDNKKYQEQYKSVLANLTNNKSTKKLKLTLGSLRSFINEYNAEVDSTYKPSFKKAVLKVRVGLFGGTTNVPFVNNPNNEKSTLFFGELELYDEATLKSHSLFFRAKRILENDDLKYSTTQLGLGYRFKFIKTKAFNLHANVTFATLNFTTATISFVNSDDEVIVKEQSVTNFDAPFIFGVGIDVKITKSIFLSFDYDEIFAAFLDNQGNSSAHFSGGIKFNL